MFKTANRNTVAVLTLAVMFKTANRNTLAVLPLENDWIPLEERKYHHYHFSLLLFPLFVYFSFSKDQFLPCHPVEGEELDEYEKTKYLGEEVRYRMLTSQIEILC